MSSRADPSLVSVDRRGGERGFHSALNKLKQEGRRFSLFSDLGQRGLAQPQLRALAEKQLYSLAREAPRVFMQLINIIQSKC